MTPRGRVTSFISHGFPTLSQPRPGHQNDLHGIAPVADDRAPKARILGRLAGGPWERGELRIAASLESVKIESAKSFGFAGLHRTVPTQGPRRSRGHENGALAPMSGFARHDRDTHSLPALALFDTYTPPGKDRESSSW